MRRHKPGCGESGLARERVLLSKLSSILRDARDVGGVSDLSARTSATTAQATPRTEARSPISVVVAPRALFCDHETEASQMFFQIYIEPVPDRPL